MLTREDLIRLTNFLDNVETHLRCDGPHVGTEKCLPTILGRYEALDISVINHKLEVMLLAS